MFRLFGRLLVAVACLLSCPTSVDAGLSALSLYPSRQTVVVAPGQSATVSVTVANNGNEPLRIRAYRSDWALGPTGEMDFMPIGKAPHSANRMIAVTPSQFVLAPATSQQVRIQIAVPAGTSGGDYHGMVFFETGPSRPPQTRPGATVLFNQRIGETIYIGVPPLHKEATIKSLAYLPAGKGQPARIGLGLQNLGNVHIRATGKLTLTPVGGPGGLVLPLEDLTVLRESKRVFYFPLESALPGGRYQATLSLDYGGNATVEAETHLEI